MLIALLLFAIVFMKFILELINLQQTFFIRLYLDSIHRWVFLKLSLIKFDKHVVFFQFNLITDGWIIIHQNKVCRPSSNQNNSSDCRPLSNLNTTSDFRPWRHFDKKMLSSPPTLLVDIIGVYIYLASLIHQSI